MLAENVDVVRMRREPSKPLNQVLLNILVHK